MKKTLVVLVVVASVLLPLTGWAGAQLPAADPDEIVPLNGTAYWATAPTGPDLAGVILVPFPAQNPTRAAWEATLAQNENYLVSPEALPENIQVSHSGTFTYASHPLNDFSEVMVYLDPTDADHLLGASKFFYDPPNYGFYTGVFESYDGGYTWTQFQPDGVEVYSMTSDPVTTFDHLGNGYFTLLTRGPTGLDMLKKPVGGSWEPPVVVDRTTYTDKQWIMGDQDPQGLSPYPGHLYMSWTSFSSPSGIVFSRSTDSNQTWSAPLQLAPGDVQGSMPGVAPDGAVYVVFGRNIFYGPTPGTMEFVKSTDGGASFTAPAVAANITAIPFHLPNPFGGTNFRSPASLPAFAVSPADGNLYVAWADYRHGDSDIYFARSTDGGATWSTAARLNDDPQGNGIDQFQPQVSVAPDGRVAVMWFDRRLACPDLPWIPAAHVGVYNGCIDTFMTRSFDEGQTWAPNLRASTQTWDWTINLPLDGSGNGFIGDYQGIASNADYDFPFWNATADLGENPDRYQEVFVALVPVVQEPSWDLSPSSKSVEPGVVQPGGLLTYTVVLANAGPDDAPAARLTDTLPLSTTYISGSLDFAIGDGGYDPATRAITWTGPVSVGLPVTVAFQVTADLALEDGATITNTALISEGAGVVYERLATATVHVPLPPFVLVTDPAAGASGVPISASLVVTFSEPLITATLAYTLTPAVSNTATAWNAASTVLTLSHGGLAYSQTYTVTVAARDLEGLALVPGPAPNPWSFTTVAAPLPPPHRTYLPLVLKVGEGSK